MEYVNLTNHDIDMLFCPDLKDGACDGRKEGENYEQKCRSCVIGNIITIPSNGKSIKATPVESHYKTENNIEYVTIDFEPNKESEKYLQKLTKKHEAKDDNYIFIGSIVAAQAFPGKVVAMVPVPGYERVPRNEKLVRSDKFSIFPKKEGEK